MANRRIKGSGLTVVVAIAALAPVAAGQALSTRASTKAASDSSSAPRTSTGEPDLRGA